MPEKPFILSKGKTDSAHYVLFGAPIDSGASDPSWEYKRTGSKKGPAEIRKASRSDSLVYYRKHNGKTHSFVPNSFGPIDEGKIPFVDIGDKTKKEIAATVADLVKQKKMAIMLGGDHSNTFEAIMGVHAATKKFCVVYFDAHPDFRTAIHGVNHATDMFHAAKLPKLSNKNSIMVGLRDIEPEEFRNLEKAHFEYVTTRDIKDAGLKETVNKIRKKIDGLPVYISIDLDVVDPAFAPEVSIGTPGGLTSAELKYLFTELAQENVVGFDVMEHVPNPKIDPLKRTALLAAKLIIGFVARQSTLKK
jgi:agmatinase